MTQLTAIDLFAGAGGATQGLTDAGFSVLAAVENDPAAVRSFRANHPTVTIEAEDIRSVSPVELRERIGLCAGDLTLLKSCPPCQGFSSLGTPSELDEERNDLVHDTWRFVEAFEPTAILMENVPGLRGDDRFVELVTRAVAAGYGVASYLLDATLFGVPQRRRRLILVAVKDVSSENLPLSLVDLLPAEFDTAPEAAGEVIARAGPIEGTEDSVHRARTPRPKTLERIKAIPVGGTRFDLPPEHQLDCHAKLGSRSATSSYGRIVAAEVAPTMTTRCATPACGRFVHPTEHRGISLREAALLQTFPPDYHFEGSFGEVERQIGNAVPVRMAHGLGLAIAALISTRAPSGS